MVDLVETSIRELVDIDRRPGVQALASLGKVQHELLIIEILRSIFLELFALLSKVVLARSQGFLELVIPTLSATSLVPRILIPSDFDKDTFGRFAGDFGNLINDTNRLVDTPANCRRTRKLVYIKLALVVAKIALIEFIHQALEAKVFIMENLHKDHGTTLARRRIGVAFAENIHDATKPTVSLSFDSSQESLGEPAPSCKAFLAYFLNLSSIKRSVAPGAILLLELLLKDGTVLEKRVPENNLLNHRVVRLIELLNAKNILTEEDIRAHLGLEAGLSLTAKNTGIADAALALQPFCNSLVANRLVLMEQVLDDSLTLGSIQAMFLVPVNAYLKSVQLIENAEFLIQQGAFGQHILTLQISTVTSHTQDELLRGLISINDVFPVPWLDSNTIHARLSLCPRETTVTSLIEWSVVVLQWANVIRNPKRHQLFELLFVFEEEVVETRLILDNSLQLLKMELIVDTAVVARLEATQEQLTSKLIHHLVIAGIVNSSGLTQQFLDLIGKAVVIEL